MPSHRRRAVVAGVILAIAGVLPEGPGTFAAAPPPPYDPCLAQGSFTIADPACLTWHPPVSGDWFGPIGEIVQHVAKRGDTLSLSFAPGVEVFFDRAISCGIGGCIGHSIRWRPDEGQLRGFWMQSQEGCGGADLSCSFRVWPDWDLGDAGERWNVLYVQHYRGIFPQKGLAHAIYVAPRYYPVRLDPVDTSGRPADARPGTAAYAVRSGRAATAGACVVGAWWTANRRVVDPPVPDCVRLDRVEDAAGQSGYEGVLPVDTGDWTIVAAPAGAASAALTARPSPFRTTSVRPVGDDIRIPIVKERRPVPLVTVEPRDETVAVGGAQEVTVTVAAVDGEVGGITVGFTDPAILGVEPDGRPRLGVTPDATVTGDRFTLGNGEERSVSVMVAGVETGEGSITAGVRGTDDVGEPVADEASAPITVIAAGSGSGLEPPDVTSAIAAADGGTLDGTASGAPGSTLSVSLWSSRAAVDGSCSQRLSGPDTAFLGTVQVPLGDDGTGPFTLEASLIEGWLAYGVATDGARVSRVGDCRLVDGAVPTVTIADAQATEGMGGAGSALSFTVTLSRPAEEPVRITLATTDDTAVAPDDYTPLVDLELEIPAGETMAEATVEVVADSDAEETEAFTITVIDAIGARIPPPDDEGQPARPSGVAVGTIIDDDATAVADAPDVRGTWKRVYRSRSGGKTLTATYTITITAQDPVTGEVTGRLTANVWAPYPDYRGRISGTVDGDQVRWRVTGAGDNSGPVEGTLIRRKGDLVLRIDADPTGKTFYTLVRPRDGG